MQSGVYMGMELKESNLYASGQIVTFPDGQSILERNLTATSETAGDAYYLVKEGDLPDAVADRAYKPVAGAVGYQWWWMIADNIAELENPLDFGALAGGQVRIPDLVRSRLENP